MPRLQVWSNATAAPYPAAPSEIRTLLADQLGRSVRFVEQIEAMYAAGARIFVEAGPGRVLTQLVGRILDGRPHLAVACDVQGESGVHRFLLAIAELAAAGVPVDARPLFAERADRLDLAALPVAAPGWRINGHLVCTNDGEPVPGGLQGADRIPEVIMNQGPESTAPEPAPVAATGRDSVVAEYLRAASQLADAQRDVMLSYLGAAVPAATGNGHAAPIEVAVPAIAAAPIQPAPATGAAPATATVTAAAGDAGQHGAGPLERRRADGRRPGVVAERTGYPLDMLDPDLDLEADLSIDSIKRVEIIGELTDTIGLSAGGGADAVDEAVVEELAQLKTLRAVVSWIDDHLNAGAPAEPAPTEPASSTSNGAERRRPTAMRPRRPRPPTATMRARRCPRHHGATCRSSPASCRPCPWPRSRASGWR